MALGFTKRNTGDVVPAGFYWNVSEWEAQIVAAPGAALKGEAGAGFVRLPLFALLVLAPLMGAVYAFFLPFIGFAMVLRYLFRNIRNKLTGAQIPVTPPLGSPLHAGQSGSARSGCAPGASS